MTVVVECIGPSFYSGLLCPSSCFVVIRSAGFMGKAVGDDRGLGNRERLARRLRPEASLIGCHLRSGQVSADQGFPFTTFTPIHFSI